MVRRAPEILSVREAESENWLDAVPHDCNRNARDHATPGLLRRCAMGVDAEFLTGLGTFVQLREWKEAERRVHTCVTGEARVRRVDATRVRARVPGIDRRVVLD